MLFRALIVSLGYLCPFGECVYSLKLSSIISYVPNKENLSSDQDLFHFVIMSLFA